MPSIPADVEVLRGHVFSDMCWVHIRWKLYRQLYGTSPERVDLLNRVASYLFYHVEGAMRDDIYLRLCHLTDCAKIGKHENVSLHQMALLVEQHEPGITARIPACEKDRDPTTETVAVALTRADTLCLPFRENRNRRIAHRDYARITQPLPLSSRNNIAEYLTVIRQAFNGILAHYDCELFALDNPYLGLERGDGDQFIARLEAIVEHLPNDAGFGMI